MDGQMLPLETLLSGHYDKITDEQRESIYGRGWLLTHYPDLRAVAERASWPPIS